MRRVSLCFLGSSHKNKPSEYEYLLQEILCDLEIETISFINCFNENQHKQHDVLIYHCFNPNQIETNYYGPISPSFQDIVKLCNIIKPKIIIQLSDEHSFDGNNKHNELYKYCKLFIRQYKHVDFDYSNEIIFLPLGYNNGFNNKINYRKIEERKYHWSWTGSLKHDRMWMISIFSYLSNGNVHINSSLSQKEIYDLYSDSIFVPCGKGYSKYDCFRIYETLVCGAIPVIVGPKQELECSFSFNGCGPPFLFYDTWEQAANECMNKLRNKKDLNALQKANIDWWNKTNLSIRKHIGEKFSEC